MKTPAFDFEDWGLINFREAWDRQNVIADDIRNQKRRSTLVFCQHPTVITIGRNGTDSNIIASQEYLENKGVDVVPINRGGDVTLHNPGQLVGYPIFYLTDFKEDLHWFLRTIENCVIDTLAAFDIIGGRENGLTGVWIEGQRKVCAIGIHSSRWITTHGFALNVVNDISEFSMIVPCGISDRSVCSMQSETVHTLDFSNVSAICRYSFEKYF